MPPELFELPNARAQIVAEAGTDPGMEVERIEFDHGIRIWLKGHPFPQKGIPTPEAIFAINTPKRLLMEFTRIMGPVALIRPMRTINAFNRISWGILSPHILKEQFMTPQAREIKGIIMQMLTELFPKSTGKGKFAGIIAHIFEYDNAYRYRLMDLASETTKRKLVAQPIREVRRLMQINRARDYKTVSDKFSMVGTLICIALCIPSVRNAFKHAILDSYFEGLQWDEADVYWSTFKKDYKYEHKGSR